MATCRVLAIIHTCNFVMIVLYTIYNLKHGYYIPDVSWCVHAWV